MYGYAENLHLTSRYYIHHLISIRPSPQSQYRLNPIHLQFPSLSLSFLNLKSTALKVAYKVSNTGTSTPSSRALLTGYPRITSTSSGLLFWQSVIILLPIPGRAMILSINRSTSPYSSPDTPHAFPTSITSLISLRVMGTASGHELSHDCVSSPVSAVRLFQAAFQTIFSHRWSWMSGRTEKLVPPAERRDENVSRRELSTETSQVGFGNRPSWRCSVLACFVMPGEVWVAPVHAYEVSVFVYTGYSRGGRGHTTHEIIVASGNFFRNGSSLPTPFCMITMVVRAESTTGSSSAMAPSWSMALWAQTIKSKGPVASDGDLTTFVYCQWNMLGCAHEICALDGTYL